MEGAPDKLCSRSISTLALALFSVVTLFILFQFWGIAFSGGDDPFIATDAIRKGGLWKASLAQAIGQGRFYYVVPWTLSQMAYLGNNFVITNLLKVISNLFVFASFFAMVKSFWGKWFAFYSSFIGLALFNWYGGDFNPYHGIPLWYSLGAGFLFLSIWDYDNSQKKETGIFLRPFVLFFACLMFYESMLLYSLSFPLIYLFRNWKSLNRMPRSLGLKNAIVSQFPIFLTLAIYILAYLTFRFFFPSGYEGSKSLNFINLHRTVQTITSFSWSGIQYAIDFSWIGNHSAVAVIMSVVVSLGIGLMLFSGAKPSLFSNNIQRLGVIALLLYFVFAPNFLYGFVDKYHGWADALGYYNGSYFSGFPLTLIISIVTYEIIIPRLSYTSFGNIFRVVVILFIWILTITNYNTSMLRFNELRDESYKWPLINELVKKAAPKLRIGSVICSETFIRKDWSFDIYDYWSIYVSNRLAKSVKVLFRDIRDPDCDWKLTFSSNKSKAELVLSEVNGKLEYSSEILRN